MCAIAGIIGYNREVQEETIERMCQLQQRRGPDSMDYIVEGQVALGHCRLSIIDLEGGHQPMSDRDGTLTIVFNGEIYNFKELRKELQGNYQFATQSDTEVILAGYRRWGIEGVLERLEGMFAFCLYDKKKGELYLARDRFGEKPLYYVSDQRHFMFASELKAFSPNLKKFSIDRHALNFYLALTYIPAPYTIFNEVRKMEPGNYAQISLDGKVEFHRYYNLLDHIQDRQKEELPEVKENIKRLMEESVKSRMISDVPIGSFLSGGIDSSVVTCLMGKLSDKPFDTFSLGFDQEEYDESPRAKIVADAIHSKHHSHILKFQDIIPDLDHIVSYYDEPFADSSALPSFYVAKLARQHVKMVLTGDSADELFAGYEKYKIHDFVRRFNRLPKFVRKGVEIGVKLCPITHKTNARLRKARKLLGVAKMDAFGRYFNMMCLGFKDKDREPLLGAGWYEDVSGDIKQRYDEIPTESTLDKELYTDLRFVLEGDMYPKVDRACMHNSLENRTPFISRALVEYLFSIHPDFKLHEGEKKYALKKSFADILPPEILGLSKKGFSIPIDYWFRDELKDEMAQLIAPEFIKAQGIFNPEILERLFQRHLSKKENNASMLWTIYVFQKWYQRMTQISE